MGANGWSMYRVHLEPIVVVQGWSLPARGDEVLDHRDLATRLLAAQEHVGPKLFG
jgi:hypothetical protein